MRRFADACWFTLSFCVFGCSSGQYTVDVEFPDAALLAQTQSIDLFVVSSCGAFASTAATPASPLASSQLIPGAMSAPLGNVSPQTVGVYARARGADCNVIATGCTAMALSAGGQGTIVVPMSAFSGVGCDIGTTCVAGRCVGADAGVDAATDVRGDVVIGADVRADGGGDARTDATDAITDIVVASDVPDTGSGCTGGLTSCAGSCVDLATDDNHCGTCATSCPSGHPCSLGACTCPSGETSCSGSCVSLASDNSNCGTCGMACVGGEACLGSVCSCGPYSNCGGFCTDTTTDSNNCGTCGHVCAPNPCSGGVCEPATNDTCSEAIPLGDGISWMGNTCGTPFDASAECGTMNGGLYYWSNIMTTGMHTITVMPSGAFVVGALGSSCTGSVVGVCGSMITVDVTTTGAYGWVVKSVAACGEFTTVMD